MPKYDFAFIVHPRNKKELQNLHSFFKLIPSFLLYLMPPRVIGDIVYKNQDGKEERGALIGIVNLPFQFLQRDARIKNKVLSAVKLAKKLGAKIVGLGSLSSPAVSGGLDIKNQPDISLTNGNALTAAVVADDVKQLLKLLQLRKKKNFVSILGATGSIGQGVSHDIISETNGMTLVARNQEKLNKLLNDLRVQHSDANIGISTLVSEVIKSDIIIVATSHHEVVLHPHDVKDGAIIYDITQPSNLRKKDWIFRNNVLVLQGGIVRFPGLSATRITGLESEESFACLAETLLLFLENKTSQDFSIGHVTQENMRTINDIAKDYGISSLLKVWGRYFSSDKVEEFIRKYV